MEGKGPERICFVIAPIGPVGSDVWRRSRQVLEYIIAPVAEACGYLVVRSDLDPSPGMIGQQIIQHLLDDDLVVADLTGHNANVFYELAIRHMVRKPVVQIMQEGEALPFDISHSRTIFFNHTDLDSVAACKEALEKQIIEVEKDPTSVDNFISHSVELRALERSDDPDARRDGEILRRLDQIGARVDELAWRQTQDERRPHGGSSTRRWSPDESRGPHGRDFMSFLQFALEGAGIQQVDLRELGQVYDLYLKRGTGAALECLQGWGDPGRMRERPDDGSRSA